VAAAMAAAGITPPCTNASNGQILFAATALEPTWALDAISHGRGEDPCIERSRWPPRARTVYQRWPRCAIPIRASASTAHHHSLKESARAMTSRYKESSIGGVAVNIVEC
jgi:hypothetical protein